MSSIFESNPEPLDLSLHVGKQITVAIIDSKGEGGEPEISLLVGKLDRTNGRYPNVGVQNGWTSKRPFGQ